MQLILIRRCFSNNAEQILVITRILLYLVVLWFF
mgnify:CR=1 FL=1